MLYVPLPVLLLRLRRQRVSLWTRTPVRYSKDMQSGRSILHVVQNETNQDTDVPFLGHELWPIQEDGDLRT